MRPSAASSRPSVAEILRADADVFARKAADYSPGADPWENFRFSASFVARVCRGLADDDLRRSTALAIGVKVSRLMTLGLTGDAKNEAIRDTLSDLRVYVAILEAQNADLGGGR